MLKFSQAKKLIEKNGDVTELKNLNFDINHVKKMPQHDSNHDSL